MKNKFLFAFASFFMLLIACSNSDDTDLIVLKTPVATQPTTINDNDFTAKWLFPATTKSFLLDVSTTENFETFVPNYNSKIVTDVNEVVNGLTGSTRYFYRIRAQNDSQTSGYSNVIRVVTSGSNGIPEDPTFLKVKANKLQNPFFIGMAVKASQLTNGSPYDVVLKNDFSSITAEYEMKMDQISVSSGVYNWTVADKIVAYGNTNGINVHGHVLVWHATVPNWLNNFSGTDAAFALEVKKYIQDVVTHYKGKIKSWDVVNEAVETDGSMRNSIFLQRMGPNYVKDCFKWAREAAIAAGDTQLLLFYNDYATSDNIAKQNKVYEIIDSLKVGNFVDGLGFQMHNTYLNPSKAQIESDINRAVGKGLKIHISELDIQVNPAKDITTFTNERKLDQKDKYEEIVKIYNALPKANKYAITVWGMRDTDSWIPFSPDLKNGIDWPLLYDDNFKPKSARTGFLKGLD